MVGQFLPPLEVVKVTGVGIGKEFAVTVTTASGDTTNINMPIREAAYLKDLIIQAIARHQRL